MTESNELERIQRKFATPWYNRFFPQLIISVFRSYTNAFDYLKLCTLPESRRHLKALLLLIFTFVPNCILRLWILLFFSFVFGIWKSCMCFIWMHKNVLSAGSKSVPGVVCGDVDIYIHIYIYIYVGKSLFLLILVYIFINWNVYQGWRICRYVYFILFKVWIVSYQNCDALGLVLCFFIISLYILSCVFIVIYVLFSVC